MTLKKTLVLGASENPNRYANKAIKKLVVKKHPVIAIGNKRGFVDDVKIETELAKQEDIDTITLYLGAKNQPSYFDIIKKLKPRRIIFNPGTENPILESLAKKEEIEVIHGCTLVMLSTNQY
ncbi:CoA-binding protein [Labilibacter sediminis]|nr:CoA-binding protein [Labilibacter sediminis]